jgi:hypothetical protein
MIIGVTCVGLLRLASLISVKKLCQFLEISFLASVVADAADTRSDWCQLECDIDDYPFNISVSYE